MPSPMDLGSERRGDVVEDLLLGELVRRLDILLLVHPQDALLPPDAALDRHLRLGRVKRLHDDAQPLPRALGIHPEVLALEAPRVGADPATRPVLLVDVPPEAPERRARHGPDAV